MYKFYQAYHSAEILFKLFMTNIKFIKILIKSFQITFTQKTTDHILFSFYFSVVFNKKLEWMMFYFKVHFSKYISDNL